MADHQTSKILSLITPEAKKVMETIWFTADYHHSHPKIVDICNRPTTREEHEEWLIKEVHNKWIQRKHVVYFLGDLSFANRVNTEKFINRLNGEKFMILGNHDKSAAGLPQFTQITQIKDFTFSQFGLNIHIVLCHYPLASWNRKPYGAWHLYGHVHGRFKAPGLAFDVGIDNSEIHQFPGGGWRPVNLYEICQIMQDKARNTGDEKISIDYGIQERDE
jgi:calcineurin-like phosphoesterase family protein